MTEFVDKLDVVGRFDVGLGGTPLPPRPQVTQASGWPPKYLGSTQYVGRFASTDPPPATRCRSCLAAGRPACRTLIEHVFG